MPFTFDYKTPSTGAHANYHVVQQVTLDAVGAQTSATVASYFSKDDKTAGKFPMYTQQIVIAGLPPDGQNAFTFAEAQLVAQHATDPAAQPAFPNRYVFAGAQLQPADPPAATPSTAA